MISISCRCAAPKIAGPRPGREVVLQPELRQQVPGPPGEVAPVEEDAGTAAELAHEQVLRDREVRDDVRLLVDDADAGRVRVGRRAEVLRRPVNLQAPASGRCTPSMMRISVDLPAPFSPTSASTSPARMPSDTSDSACTTPKRLETPLHGEERTRLRRLLGGGGRIGEAVPCRHLWQIRSLYCAKLAAVIRSGVT